MMYYGDHQPDVSKDTAAISNASKTTHNGPPVLNPEETSLFMDEIIAILDAKGLLTEKAFCLKLAANIIERVGYQSAGYTSTSTVTELMAMSARASELARKLEKSDNL